MTRHDRISNVLREAANICARGWVKGAFACKANGEACRVRDPEAVKWCALGAIRRASAKQHAIANEACTIFARCLHAFPCTWNDAPRRTQAQVVRALRSAAQSAKRDSARK